MEFYIYSIPFFSNKHILGHVYFYEINLRNLLYVILNFVDSIKNATLNQYLLKHIPQIYSTMAQCYFYLFVSNQQKMLFYQKPFHIKQLFHIYYTNINILIYPSITKNTHLSIRPYKIRLIFLHYILKMITIFFINTNIFMLFNFIFNYLFIFVMPIP